MKARSLRSLLTRQWATYAVCVAALFGATALLLLFLLEDAFIDRSLAAAARSMQGSAQGLTRLPPEFSVYPLGQAPLDVHAQLPFATPGRPFEMRLANRRHAHVLVSQTARGEPVVIVYDVTDQLLVTPRLGMGLGLALALTALALAAALLLARMFVGRATRHAETLAADVRRSRDPAELRAIATNHPVSEFRALLCLHADLWESQRAALENERQTLAYLGHELRTPLQSAKTSLALLQEDRSDPATHERLARAVARLTRASQAVLWLATEKEPDLTEQHSVLQVVGVLVDEMRALAAAVDRTIEVDLPADIRFHGPLEVAEVVIGNLLLNALHHGAGPVQVSAFAGGFSISNAALPHAGPPGFGLGLEIVRRLARRIGWRLEFESQAQRVQVLIRIA